MNSPESPKRSQFLILFLLALLLRLAVVWVTVHNHPATWFFAQATELARLADSLASGHGLSSPFGGATGPSAFLAPGYPAIVALVFAVCGPYSFASAATLMTLQAAFGAATVLVLMLLTQRAFGRTVANVAGLVWAISPPLLWLPTLFWETSLSILLATTILALGLYCVESPGIGSWIAMALTAALALAVNPSLLPIILCATAWAAWRTRSMGLPLTVIGVCVLVVTPWAVRNYRTLHAFIPLRSNIGYELWQGNHAGSDGFFSPELHLNVNAVEFGRYQQLGEVDYMHEKGALGKEAIVADLGRFASLSLKRAFYFWTGIMRTRSSFIVGYITSTSLLGFAGLALLWKRDRQRAIYFLLPLLLFPVPYYMTHPDFRFRLVLDPLLVALAASALRSRLRDKIA